LTTSEPRREDQPALDSFGDAELMMNGEMVEKHKEISIPVSGSEEECKTEHPKEPEDETTTSVLSESAYVEQLQRLQAEFSNYRKRVNRERESFFSMAKSELAVKLLSVLDDFERMLNHHGQNNPNCVDGVQLIYQKFKKILLDEGLKEIPSVGEMFNPEIHEAVSVEETDEEKEGIIVEEWEKGYRFGEKLLRPSRVKVGKYTKSG